MLRGAPAEYSRLCPSRNPLFIGNAFATIWCENDKQKQELSRNPLFIGNAFATLKEQYGDRIQDLVAIPYSSGMRLLLSALPSASVSSDSVAIPYSSGMLLLPQTALPTSPLATSRNPLFIGNAFATGNEEREPPPSLAAISVAIPYSSGMLLLQVSPLFSRAESNNQVVAIPYSSGMLLLLEFKLYQPLRSFRRNPLFIGNAFATEVLRGYRRSRTRVAIPYSSGMLLLPRSRSRAAVTATPHHSRNPLFIGNAFATLSACAGMDAGLSYGESQSPIHRECFCYQLRWPEPYHPSAGWWVAIPYSSGTLLLQLARRLTGSATSPCRNPLFIGNAFATSLGERPARRGPRSQSPIHRECFCYCGYKRRLTCPILVVAIPYSSGMLLLPSGLTAPRHRPSTSGRNPLFIGNAFATQVARLPERSPELGRNPLFIGNAFATFPVSHQPDSVFSVVVAIPYSSGMLLLPYNERPHYHRRRQAAVAIPYSSGMLLLPHFQHGPGRQPALRWVAIPYSSGMLLLLYPTVADLLRTGQLDFVAIPYSSGMLLLPHLKPKGGFP